MGLFYEYRVVMTTPPIPFCPRGIEAVFVIQHERPNQLEYSSLCEFKDTFNRGSFESDSQLAVIIETSIINVHVMESFAALRAE